MIVEFLVGLLVGLLMAILSVLPEAGSLGLSGFGAAVTAFLAFDSALPVSETLLMAGISLAVIAGIFITRLVLMVWHALPGKFS